MLCQVNLKFKYGGNRYKLYFSETKKCFLKFLKYDNFPKKIQIVSINVKINFENSEIVFVRCGAPPSNSHMGKLGRMGRKGRGRWRQQERDKSRRETRERNGDRDREK